MAAADPRRDIDEDGGGRVEDKDYHVEGKSIREIEMDEQYKTYVKFALNALCEGGPAEQEKLQGFKGMNH